MNHVDLVVRGGLVASAQGAFTADIGIDGDRIVQVGGSLEGTEEISAAGKLVLPGGIDVHVHLSSGRPSSPSSYAWVDNFYSGSLAAIAGGVTTFGNMTFPWPGDTLDQALARDLEQARNDAAVDYILHPVLFDPSEQARLALPALAEKGFRTLKIFLTETTFNSRINEFLEAIAIAAEHGVLVLMHCEDGALLDAISTNLTRLGRTDISEYALSRPDFVEEAAIQRAVSISQTLNAAVYAVHVSSAKAIQVGRAAKGRGLPFFVETRPMYLHLTSEALRAPDGPKFVGAPPLREVEDATALWLALQDGTVDTVASDHAPWSLEAKLDQRLDFRTARQGVADLETSLPMLFSEGVRTGRLSLSRFVELVSAKPAQLFGLWPRKGVIAPGSDADLAIWDPTYEYVIEAARHQSRADYSVYEGRKVTGAPVTVISRGEIVMSDRVVSAQRGRGVWLAARPPSRWRRS